MRAAEKHVSAGTGGSEDFVRSLNPKPYTAKLGCRVWGSGSLQRSPPQVDRGVMGFCGVI